MENIALGCALPALLFLIVSKLTYNSNNKFANFITFVLFKILPIFTLCIILIKIFKHFGI